MSDDNSAPPVAMFCAVFPRGGGTLTNSFCDGTIERAGVGHELAQARHGFSDGWGSCCGGERVARSAKKDMDPSAAESLYGQ